MELVSEKRGGEELQAASTRAPPGAGGKEEPRNPEGAERRGRSRGCSEVEVTACDLHGMQSLRRTQRGGSELTERGAGEGRAARAGTSETRTTGRAALDRSPGSIEEGVKPECAAPPAAGPAPAQSPTGALRLRPAAALVSPSRAGFSCHLMGGEVAPGTRTPKLCGRQGTNPKCSEVLRH